LFKSSLFRHFLALLSGAAVGAVLVLTAISSEAQETIEFPDEELARESVLPLFDLPVTVRNRRINFANRIELGGGFGYSLLEPFFNPWSGSLTGAYQWNEDMGVAVNAAFFLPGVTDYANQLNPIPGTVTNANIQYAPRPRFALLGHYQYSALYGKMSVTKDYTIWTSLYGLVGGGFISFGDAYKPAFSFGLGQRFFVFRDFAIRFDLRFLFYPGPNPIDPKLATKSKEVSSSELGEKWFFATTLGVNLIWLMPAF
jgi:outer membrane beta-barrel protein